MGKIIGLDYNAVIKILEMYGGDKEMFNEILYCWNVERGLDND